VDQRVNGHCHGSHPLGVGVFTGTSVGPSVEVGASTVGDAADVAAERVPIGGTVRVTPTTGVLTAGAVGTVVAAGGLVATGNVETTETVGAATVRVGSGEAVGCVSPTVRVGAGAAVFVRAVVGITFVGTWVGRAVCADGMVGNAAAGSVAGVGATVGVPS